MFLCGLKVDYTGNGNGDTGIERLKAIFCHKYDWNVTSESIFTDDGDFIDPVNADSIGMCPEN